MLKRGGLVKFAFCTGVGGVIEAISGSGGLLWAGGSESKFSKDMESRRSGDERKGEESCGGGGVSKEVGAWGSMIGGGVLRQLT